MGQPSYPSPPQTPQQSEFHLPRSNLFRNIRAQLAAIERPAQFKTDMEPIMGFLLVLVLSGLMVTLFALGINTTIVPALGQAGWIGIVIIAPIVEEFAKAMCMIAVAYFNLNMFPNRRYGAAVGAAAGLGFGAMEGIIQIATGQLAGIYPLIRLIFTPIMHPLWSAFVGIGAFVFASKKSAGKGFGDSLLGLPLLFFLFGLLNHAIWNAMVILIPAARGVWATPYLSSFLALLIVTPIFGFFLRDFLGGHYNFQHVLDILPEPPPFYPTVAPPPPPVETAPACPTCGQPLAFIREYNRWYCAKEKKYV